MPSYEICYLKQNKLPSLSYSKFVAGMKLANVEVDHKILSDIAIYDKPAFGLLVEKVKAALIANTTDKQ